jgi:bifunctional enzyme CysN/CysC
MHERPLDREKTYILKHTTQAIRVQVDDVEARLDLATLEEGPAQGLELNEIARVKLTCHRAIYFDAYQNNRSTGAFILVDSLNNNTVAAGMIRPVNAQGLDDALEEIRAGSGLDPKTQVSPAERRERFGQSGATVWLTGLPGSGRWSLAYALERRLFDLGHTAHVVDPYRSNLGEMISAARACTNAGLITICAFPSYKRAERAVVREKLGDGRFFEVFVDASLALCKERRPDGDFEGFEAPETHELRVSLDDLELEQAVEAILASLEKAGQFG